MDEPNENYPQKDFDLDAELPSDFTNTNSFDREQSPHEKMTDQEIQEMICALNTDIRELKEFFNEQLDYLEGCAYKLKRHFCPEKFTTMKVPMGYLKDLVIKCYE